MPRRDGRTATGARYNLRNARRARAAGLTTTGILVFVSVFMTHANISGALSRAREPSGGAYHSARAPASDPSSANGEERGPTDEQIGAFASLFPGASVPETLAHDDAAATGSSLPADPSDPVVQVQAAIQGDRSTGEATDPRDPSVSARGRSAPIGSIATSQGVYAIHRDSGGRVFAERTAPECADEKPANAVKHGSGHR